MRFGTGKNNLYQIVSHEAGGAKLVNAEPLKNADNTFITKAFSNSTTALSYSPTDSNYTLAYWLNHDFLNPSNGYLTSEQMNMIESKNWYLGRISIGDSYRLTKYTTTTGTTLTSSQVNAKVGLLRIGEQMASQFNGVIFKDGTSTGDNIDYWTLTIINSSPAHMIFISIYGYGYTYQNTTNALGIRPAVHLKQSIKITGGNGTKENPFTISG